MELFRSHVFGEKSHRAVIVIAPVAAENPALGVHLRVERGIRKGSKDQRKGSLQAILYGELGDLVEDRGGVFIKTDDECAHNPDFALSKAADTGGIFSRPVRKFMHGVNGYLGERFEADVHTDAA